MLITTENAHKELLKFRARHGITQEKLCDSTGVARATVTNIENGNKIPRATTLFKLNKYIETFPS